MEAVKSLIHALWTRTRAFIIILTANCLFYIGRCIWFGNQIKEWKLNCLSYSAVWSIKLKLIVMWAKSAKILGLIRPTPFWWLMSSDKIGNEFGVENNPYYRLVIHIKFGWKYVFAYMLVKGLVGFFELINILGNFDNFGIFLSWEKVVEDGWYY